MARLRIPPDQIPGLKKLVNLTPSALHELSTALQDAPLKLYQFELAKAVADRVVSIPKEDAEAIIEAVWPVEFVRLTLEVSREMFLEDVKDAFTESGIGSEEQIQRVMPTLANMLQSTSLSTSAKARVLLTEGNSYCKGKILTDIRPVFGEDVTDPPNAALIVHHLTLSYHANGTETVDVVVSLDSDDIDDLMEVLERAKSKERRLHLLLSEAKITSLDSE